MMVLSRQCKKVESPSLNTVKKIQEAKSMPSNISSSRVVENVVVAPIVEDDEISLAFSEGTLNTNEADQDNEISSTIEIMLRDGIDTSSETDSVIELPNNNDNHGHTNQVGPLLELIAFDPTDANGYICRSCKKHFHTAYDLENHFDDHMIYPNKPKTIQTYRCERCHLSFRCGSRNSQHHILMCTPTEEPTELEDQMKRRHRSASRYKSVDRLYEYLDDENESTTKKKRRKSCFTRRPGRPRIIKTPPPPPSRNTDLSSNSDELEELYVPTSGILIRSAYGNQSGYSSYSTEHLLKLKNNWQSHRTRRLSTTLQIEIKKIELELQFRSQRHTFDKDLNNDRLNRWKMQKQIQQRIRNCQKIYKCKETNCDLKTFETLHDLMTHEKDEHQLLALFHCVLCRKTFTKDCYLKQHLKNHHYDSVHCPICDEKFECLEERKNHLLLHNDYDYVCYFCDRSYVDEKLLKNHEDIEHGITSTAIKMDVLQYNILETRPPEIQIMERQSYIDSTPSKKVSRKSHKCDIKDLTERKGNDIQDMNSMIYENSISNIYDKTGVTSIFPTKSMELFDLKHHKHNLIEMELIMNSEELPDTDTPNVQSSLDCFISEPLKCITTNIELSESDYEEYDNFVPPSLIDRPITSPSNSKSLSSSSTSWNTITALDKYLYDNND